MAERFACHVTAHTHTQALLAATYYCVVIIIIVIVHHRCCAVMWLLRLLVSLLGWCWWRSFVTRTVRYIAWARGLALRMSAVAIALRAPCQGCPNISPFFPAAFALQICWQNPFAQSWDDKIYWPQISIAYTFCCFRTKNYYCQHCMELYECRFAVTA